ncbi:MAG: hypothetical protein WHV60_00580 [Bacteroidota bacterium]
MLIFYNIVSEVIQVLRPVTMLLPYRERERESSSTRSKWSEYTSLWHRCSQCRGPPKRSKPIEKPLI